MKLSVLTGALLVAATASPAQERAQLVAGLRGDDGIGGVVTMTESRSGAVLVRIEAAGFEPGWHGVHVHEQGICTGNFESAGGHIAAGLSHGIDSPDGPHPGDLPNVYAHADGVIRAEFFTRGFSLSQRGETRLLDDDGAAVIVHSGADDYASQPSGDSGARVACGVLGVPD